MSQNPFTLYHSNIIFTPKTSFLTINTSIKFKPATTTQIKQREEIIELIYQLTNYETEHQNILMPDGSEKETKTDITLFPTLNSSTYETHNRKANLSYSCEVISSKKGLEDYIIELNFAKPVFLEEDIKPLSKISTKYHKDNFNIELNKNQKFLIRYSLKKKEIIQFFQTRETLVNEIFHGLHQTNKQIILTQTNKNP